MFLCKFYSLTLYPCRRLWFTFERNIIHRVARRGPQWAEIRGQEDIDFFLELFANNKTKYTFFI